MPTRRWRRGRATSPAGLRCLVCQNQSIDDSDAPLARDLRLLVRERLKAGDSDEEVRDYLVARYGDFILLKPPFEASTLLLWLTPVVVLAAGAVAALVRFRKPAETRCRLSPARSAISRGSWRTTARRGCLRTAAFLEPYQI